MTQEAAGNRTPEPHSYGRYVDQRADLHLPAGTPPERGWPVVVLIHGGFWRERHTKDLTTPIAQDLARHGLAAWNIEFRRVEGAGGWPATFEDVGAAIDHLASPELRVDLSRVGIVGHSAGGQLALWAAGRSRLPSSAPGADPRVAAHLVVGLAPVADLQACHGSGRSDGTIAQLLGGAPDEVPERWELADPMSTVGHGIPLLLVHGVDDVGVPLAYSSRYAEAARAAGDPVELVAPACDHMTLIDPAATPWQIARQRLLVDLASDDGSTVHFVR